MKKAIQSKTIWFNGLLVALPFILEGLTLIDVDLLTMLGVKPAEQVVKLLAFVMGIVNIFLRVYSTSVPIGFTSPPLELDMYELSLNEFRNNIGLSFEDYENLWIVINCTDCVIEYGVTPIEQTQINTLINLNYPDPTVFNADKKPYPKGKY